MTISRVTRPRALARAAYDRLSPWYDRLAGSGERRLTAQALESLNLQPGEAVLEIGCGTGHALRAAAAAVGRAGRACGLDLSPGMLRQARGRTAADIALVCGDGLKLPFGAGSFDAILMSFTLELFDTPEIADVLGECRRVLVGSGRIGVAALSRAAGETRAVRLYEWAHRQWPVWVDCRPIYAARAMQAQGLRVQTVMNRTLWGLPVEIVVAGRGPG